MQSVESAPVAATDVVITPAPAPAPAPAPEPVTIPVSEPVVAPAAAPAPAPAPAAAPAAAPAVVNADLQAAFQAVSSNAKFVTDVTALIDSILIDGNITPSDIPQILIVSSEIIHNIDSIHLSTDLIPVLIKMLLNEVVVKKNLVPENMKEDFDRMVDSSVKLLMMQPLVKDKLVSCFAFLSCKK